MMHLMHFSPLIQPLLLIVVILVIDVQGGSSAVDRKEATTRKWLVAINATPTTSIQIIQAIQMPLGVNNVQAQILDSSQYKCQKTHSPCPYPFWHLRTVRCTWSDDPHKHTRTCENLDPLWSVLRMVRPHGSVGPQCKQFVPHRSKQT
jgi:hypothetical protein